MPPIIPVTDPDDLRIAAFRDVRERDLVGREGRFIAEGEVVLRLLLAASRYRPAAVLIADKRVEKLGALLGDVPDGVPVYAAGQTVLDAIAGFHLHRGILAVAERGAEPDAEALLAALPDRAMVVVAIGIANHDNMGGIFRNAAAFGADALLIDAGSCDPLYRKAIRVSVGAVLKMPFARFETADRLFDILARHRITPLALTPSGAVSLADLDPPQRVAVLLGAEGPGLSDDVLARALAVRIPMAGGMDSLNVATSSGIVLHHLASRGVTRL